MRLRAFVNKKKLEKLKTYPSLSSTFWILLGADHTVVTMEHRLKNLSFHFIPRYFVLLFSIILRQLWLLYQVRADLLLITLLISGSQAHRTRLRTGYCCFERPEVFLFGHMHLIRILLDSWVYLGESRSRSWVQTSLLLFGTLDLCQDSPIQKFRSVNNN